MDCMSAELIRRHAKRSLCCLLVQGAPILQPPHGSTSDSSSSQHAPVKAFKELTKPVCSLSTLIPGWSNAGEQSLKAITGSDWDDLSESEKVNRTRNYIDSVPAHLLDAARSLTNCIDSRGVRIFRSELDVQTAVFDLLEDLLSVLKIDRTKIFTLQNCNLRREGVPDILLLNSAWRMVGFVEVKKDGKRDSTKRNPFVNMEVGGQVFDYCELLVDDGVIDHIGMLHTGS